MPGTSITFEAFGIKQVEYRTRALGAAAINTASMWARVLEFFFGVEEITFKSQGRRGGGSWARDSDDWLARKAREGLDPRINFATDALYEAMTFPEAPGQIVRISPDGLEFGSDLPQAGPSQKNRPFVKLIPSDRLEIREIIKEHFANAWREAAS